MKKAIWWIVGAALGATTAALLVALFSPITGDEVIYRLSQGYQETLARARQASEDRRTELEAELQTLQKHRKK